MQEDELRKNVGMVFQRPNPFPKSIFENVAYGLRVNGVTDSAFIRCRVEEALRGAALWDEVKDKLKVSAYALSGGQQQRVALARALVMKPKLLLLDEHTAALDPKTAAKVLEITDMIVNRDHLTTMMITHNMQDAINHGNRLIMMMEGKIILDIEGEEKKKLTVRNLLDQFEKASGQEFSNDSALLS